MAGRAATWMPAQVYPMMTTTCGRREVSMEKSQDTAGAYCRVN